MIPARDRVRAAAVTLFATRGFHGTGIRNLAEAAGLSSASLYHYMGTKEDLLVRIMVESLERLLVSGRELLGPGGSPVEQLAKLVQLHVVAHALLKEETMVVDNELRALSPERREEVQSLRDEYEDLWREVIDEGYRRGIFVVANPTIVRLGLLELCTGAARWYSPSGTLSLLEIADAHVEMAFAMLGVYPNDSLTAAPPIPSLEPILKQATEVWGLSLS